MSVRFVVKLAALASTCWLSVSQAMAENRIALVIGNSDYTAVQVLPNPANDAKAMSRFLSSAGFQVMEAPNLTQGDLRRTIGDFASMVGEKGPDTVALVFYAGHGLQVDGENYLVPVDAHISREADVPLQAMRLADVMNALAAVPSKTRIVILDACRNNPFSAINKTAGRGLAIVDAPNGSLVSYSTAPGTEASDGDGENSPYTAALMKVGQEPGLPIEQALKRVRLSVSEATSRQQFPWESSSLTDEFSFFPGSSAKDKGKEAQQGTSPAARPETRTVESWRGALRGKSARDAYDIVVRADQVEAYQAYLGLYPNQPLAPTVRTIVERRQVVVAWYSAVTINTPAAYQGFLASYGSSDYAETANRLMSRSLARSVSNAGAAFASAGTCPCSQPGNGLPRRTDLGTPQNYSPAGPGTGGGGPGGSSTGGTGGGGVTVVNNPPVVYPDPIPVVVPPIYVPGRTIHNNPPAGGDKPPSGGTTSNPTGGTSNPTGGTTHNPPRGTGGVTTGTNSGGTGTGTGTIYSKPKGSSGNTQSGSTGNTARLHTNHDVTTNHTINSGNNLRALKTPNSGLVGGGGGGSILKQSSGFGGMGRMGGMGGMGGMHGRR